MVYIESARVRGSNKAEEMCFKPFLEDARIELCRSFHQEETHLYWNIYLI